MYVIATYTIIHIDIWDNCVRYLIYLYSSVNSIRYILTQQEGSSCVVIDANIDQIITGYDIFRV